jgi:hypothetical protein
MLGKHRYACAIENGRPGCRKCHEAQERGELRFRKADYNKAVRALNKVLKSKIQEML